MMANEIKDKYGASTAMTITLASLASSTAGVGRQSTMVDNTTARYQDVLVHCKVTVGTTPTANTNIYVYGLRHDDAGTSNIETDGCGDTDAALTVVNAQLLGVLRVPDATSDKAYEGEFIFHRPGPMWGIAIVHDTGVALNATAGNHAIRYVGLNPEVQ